MIDLQPYKDGDLFRLWPFLHPVSAAETGAKHNLTVLRQVVEDFGRDDKHMTTGRRSSDQRIMFVAGTAPLDEYSRGTFFLFAKGFDTTIGFGLRRWAQRERETFPGQKFFSVSEGDHPMKYRFLKIAGCQHSFGPVFVTGA